MRLKPITIALSLSLSITSLDISEHEDSADEREKNRSKEEINFRQNRRQSTLVTEQTERSLNEPLSYKDIFVEDSTDEEERDDDDDEHKRKNSMGLNLDDDDYMSDVSLVFPTLNSEVILSMANLYGVLTRFASAETFIIEFWDKYAYSCE